MYLGLVFGVGLGVAAVLYLEVEPMLDRFCLVGIALMGGQLFGATVGAAVGMPRNDAQ